MFIINIVLHLEFVSLEKIECLFFSECFDLECTWICLWLQQKNTLFQPNKKNSNAILLLVNTLHFIHSNDLGQKTIHLSK